VINFFGRADIASNFDRLKMLRPNCAVAHRFSTARKFAAAAALIVFVCPFDASAQQQPVQPAPQQFQQSGEWGKLPKMLLERQFAGPLQDTVIQRLRDPVDGTICYLYLPISAPHSPTTNTGFVQYGSNTIGSINCVPNIPTAAVPASRK
jgi:hypothetical protein